LSYRRLWVLIKQLPPESATQTALRDEDLDVGVDDLIAADPEPEDRFGPWSKQDYLLAHLIDAVRENTYAVSVAGSLEPKPKPPALFPRPGVRRPESAPQPLSEAAVLYLNRLRPTGG
jgi:hypothetical protein